MSPDQNTYLQMSGKQEMITGQSHLFAFPCDDERLSLVLHGSRGLPLMSESGSPAKAPFEKGQGGQPFSLPFPTTARALLNHPLL